MQDPPNPFQFFADRGDARLRLDQVLTRRVTAVSRMSRSLAHKWIDAGIVTINGQVARRASARVPEHAVIHVALPPETELRSIPQPEEASLDVLYEDETLIAINKPPGVVVHPSYKRLSGTLLNAVLWHVRRKDGVRPGILTRLDKDTSGIVVIAFAPGAHAAMQRDAAAGRIRKEYLAVVHGTPRPAIGVIRDPLGRHPDDRRRVITTQDGAPSETRYEVLQTAGELSLVRCELITGRTHQIRVHLSAHGWPIAGDCVYGGNTQPIARQALHAWRITMPHPATRNTIVVEASMPPDWRFDFKGFERSERSEQYE